MFPSQALLEHRDAVRRIVLEQRACNPRFFGSVARGEDSEISDHAVAFLENKLVQDAVIRNIEVIRLAG